MVFLVFGRTGEKIGGSTKNQGRGKNGTKKGVRGSWVFGVGDCLVYGVPQILKRVNRVLSSLNVF